MQKLKHELDKHFDEAYDNYSVVFRNERYGKFSDVDYFLLDHEKKHIILCVEWF